MVDLSGGPDGPLELAFSNDVFILPGIVVVGLSSPDLESLQKLEELLASSGNKENPLRKDVLELIESADLSDEVRESLRAMLRGDVPQVFGSYGSGALLAVLFVIVICAIVLFFAYKLYKSIKDKETKKEEKRKAKLLKKKK